MRTLQRTLLLALLATFTIQLAGCGAADVESAKLYRQRRDYVSADKMLAKAIQEDPTNDEAWYLYAMNLNDLHNYEKIADIIDTAMLYSPTHRTELEQLKFNTWVELYNGASGAYNQNPDSKDAQQAAIGYLEKAKILEPDQPETYELLGTVYYQSGDTIKGLQNFQQEISELSSSYNQGVQMGLMLHQTPTDVSHTMSGAPAKQQYVSLGGSDSALVYSYPAKQAYIYFEHSPQPPYDWQLTGWRVTSDASSGMNPIPIDTSAYELVASNYYQKGIAAQKSGDNAEMNAEFQKAIPLLLTLQQLDPSDVFASQAIPDVYTRMGQSGKAKEAYEQILSSHPSAAMYVAYGTLLMGGNDYEGAVTQYQKALALEPNNQSALFDIAAAYKNRARNEQQAKNPAYKDDLVQSSNYFEKLRSINRSDANTLMNLAENYNILGQKDKVLSLVSDIEALKSSPEANSHEYWDLLARVYAQANRPKDAEAAYKKSDELKQQGK